MFVGHYGAALALKGIVKGHPVDDPGNRTPCAGLSRQ